MNLIDKNHMAKLLQQPWLHITLKPRCALLAGNGGPDIIL